MAASGLRWETVYPNRPQNLTPNYRLNFEKYSSWTTANWPGSEKKLTKSSTDGSIQMAKTWFPQMMTIEVVAQTCSVKKVYLEISQNSQENICARVSFLIKLACNFIKKETLAQVFSCEFWEISKNTPFL